MGKALIIKGADFSQVAVDTIEIAVGQPTISIDLFGNVTISSPNGEDIYYTTDGSTPTNQSTKYTAGFSVQMNTTVKAVCYLGGNYSDVASKRYDGTLQAPTIAIATNGMVTITATDNASIRYTTDGSEPTSELGSVYASTFKVADGVTVKAIAYLTSGSSMIVSAVSSAKATVYEWIFGKGFGGNLEVIDVPDAALSPKVYFDNGTNVQFYFTAVSAGSTEEAPYNRIGEFDENDNCLTVWNSQGTSPRTIKAYDAKTVYMRFSTKLSQDYIGKNGARFTKNGETVDIFYNGEMPEE